MRWQNHGEDERTWEPLQQLFEDVPDMVKKYVLDVDTDELNDALEEAEAAAKAVARGTSRTPSDDPVANEVQDIGREDPAYQQEKANKARDARAAARAQRN